MDNIKKLIDKNTICYAATLALIMVFASIQFVFPKFGEIMDKQKMITDLKDQLSQETVKQQSLLQSASKDLPVSIYKSSYQGLDLENSAVDLVEQFVQITRATKNRIIEISFSSKPLELSTPALPASTVPASSSSTPGAPATPPVATTAQSSAGIITLTLTINNTYLSLQDLLRKIYVWKYLAAIKDIVISIDPSTLNQTQNNGSSSTGAMIESMPSMPPMGPMNRSSMNEYINKSIQVMNGAMAAKNRSMEAMRAMEEDYSYGYAKSSKSTNVYANGLTTKLVIDLYINRS